MHELSLAMEVIELAQHEAGKNGISSVGEVVIEVGDLSGVVAEAFQSALEMLVRDTLLERALISMIRTPGHGRCNACNRPFEMKSRMDTCPECGCFPSEISGGEEFRLVSITGK